MGKELQNRRMKTKIGTKNNGIWMGLLAFLIPVGIVLLACQAGDRYPFGDNSLVYHDMLYQYEDFFLWFHRVLRGQESWSYSFHAGLGGNTTALVAYYLASPLNILLLAAPAGKMSQFLTLLIILKLALCGVTAYVYLRKVDLAEDILAVFLSVGYALMGYNILQCSNVMWLDGVIVLPILALGIRRMIWENKRGVYYFALFYAIASNWYMGYMLCIFACMYFLLETLLYCEGRKFSVKEVSKSVGIFAGYSILSVLSSCFLFVPQTLQMMKQGEPMNPSVFSPDVGFSYLEGFRDLFLQGDKLTQMDYIPPVFVGTVSLLLALAFFLCKRISRYKRIVLGSFLLGFLFMLCFRPFNYMFTGFKIPNNHYFRQAFIFGFLMLVIAGHCLKELRRQKLQPKEFAGSAAILVGAALVFDMLQNYNPRTGVYVSCAFLGVAALVFSLLLIKKRGKTLGIFLLLLCMTLEFSAKLAVEFEDHTQSVSYDTAYNEMMQEEINELKETDPAFDMYRVDKTLTRNAGISFGFGNEGMSFGYSSVAQYASTDDMQMKELLMKWGYGSNNKHLPYYPILPMDSILGVKYIYSRYDICQAEPVKTGIFEDISLYENPYALPVAFGVDENIGEIEWSDDVFSNHEKLYDALTGYQVDLYDSPKITDGSTDKATWRTWTLEISEDGPLYLYFKPCNEGMTIRVNGNYLFRVSWNNNHVCYAGEFTKGDTVEVKVSGGEYLEDYGILAATLQMENFEKAIAFLKENATDVGEASKGLLTLTYEGDKEGRLLVTIPYDKGWKATVNGVEVQPEKAAGNFMEIPVEAGENIVNMEYSVPGLLVGCGLSLAGIAGFAAWELLRRARRPAR